VKAIRVHQPGEPEVMKLEEVPDPRAGPGQIVVRVHLVGEVQLTPSLPHIAPPKLRPGPFGPHPATCSASNEPSSAAIARSQPR
jgi:NADPH2:quinone reductase